MFRCSSQRHSSMFRFSCFHANVQGNKAKKTIQPSTETMVKTLQDGSQNQVFKDSFSPPSSNSPLEQMNDREIHQTGRLRKSQSVESGLYQRLTESDGDLGFSCDSSKSHNDSTPSINKKYHDANPIDQCKRNPNSQSQTISSLANDVSLFSIGDQTPSDKGANEISDTPLSGELAGDSAEPTSGSGTPSMMKSHSLPDIKASTSPGKCSFKHAASMSRSSNDLQALDMKQKEEFINESDDQIREDQERENNLGKTEDMDRYFHNGFDSYMLSDSAKDWVLPITDDINDVNTLQGDSSSQFPNKDFKIKRIEDWVTDLQHCGPPLDETNEFSESVDPSAVPSVDVSTINGVTTAGVDHKITPGMEAAKRYISSLSANTSTAQLANHGLVVMPFLSAFVSLKVLNLAGNNIVRITAGALPRGLHTLNLSKNNISTIEGLRELTRLRILDVSYNRILRIGHGLASCSSLKELYLAGNKIGEVEGLHRLLKLSILDLRFNKISTAKCLGQLAANYNSLQAINLEGNPCQKNVGEEQLKKHLQGLLPHLVYYNRQPMKVSTLKDGTDRAVRLGMNSQQFDRGLRVDRKATRKSNHGVVAGKRSSSSSSSYAHRSQTVESLKPSKGKQGHLPLPPIRTKVSTETCHHSDATNKGSGLSIRKSHSEGTLGAF